MHMWESVHDEIRGDRVWPVVFTMKVSLNWRFGASETEVYRFKGVKEILGISVKSVGDLTEEMLKMWSFVVPDIMESE